MSSEEVAYGQLDVIDLERIGEIDRTERIRTGVLQHGDRLEEIEVEWDAPPWSADGESEHSVEHQRHECERLLRAGGAAIGAFDGGRLVGIGVVLPRLRPGIGQLAFLHVSDGYRARGIGVALTLELERVAREAGDVTIVVSATPSRNTVRFYLGRGYQPMQEPLPELLAREPEDVHLEKTL